MPQPPFSGPGKVMVTAMFWLLVAYSFCSLVGSLTRDLYGTAPVPISQASGSYSHTWCVAQVAAAKLELENQTLFQLQSLSPDSLQRANWHQWQAQWLADVQRDAALCKPADPHLRSAYDNLTILAQHYNALLGQLAGAPLEARTALNDDLRHLWRAP